MFGFVLFVGVLLASRGEALTAPVLGCGGELRSESGRLQSPRVTRFYPPNTDCVWTIMVDAVATVKLHFHLKSELEAGCNGKCYADYVEVRDGGNATAKRLGRYCSNKFPNEVVSSGNQMWIKFHSDESHQKTGFIADYRTVYPCGGQLSNAESGTLKSPKKTAPSDVYPPNTDCIWTIKVDADATVKLHFSHLKFELEAGSKGKCSADYVEVRDGGVSTARVLGKYCGTMDSSKLVVSSGSQMWIKFHSNAQNQFKGFTATYLRGQSCGGERSEETGTVKSPFDKDVYVYPPNTDCIWTLKADGASIKWWLDIEPSFELQGKNSTGHCAYDYVEVRDGGNSSAKILAKYCGKFYPPAVISSGNQMWIKFHSDSKKEFPGFVAQYYKEHPCGGKLREEIGRLTSPSWGLRGHTECIWTINVDGASKLTLNFTTFVVGQGNCVHYVKVGKGEKVGKQLLGTYCGEKTPFHVVATGGKMWIKIKMDKNGFMGFVAKYWKGGPADEPGRPEDDPSGKLQPNES